MQTCTRLRLRVLLGANQDPFEGLYPRTEGDMVAPPSFAETPLTAGELDEMRARAVAYWADPDMQAQLVSVHALFVAGRQQGDDPGALRRKLQTNCQ